MVRNSKPEKKKQITTSSMNWHAGQMLYHFTRQPEASAAVPMGLKPAGPKATPPASQEVGAAVLDAKLAFPSRALRQRKH